MTRSYISAITLLPLIVVLTIGCSLSSDTKLKQRFYEHGEMFQELTSMARENNKLVSITIDSIVTPTRIIAHTERTTTEDWTDCLQYGLSRQRYRRYQELLRLLDLQGLGIAGSTVRLTSNPVLSNYYAKGFVYSTQSLEPRVLDLDHFHPSSEQRHNHVAVYESLGSGWYLFLQPL